MNCLFYPVFFLAFSCAVREKPQNESRNHDNLNHDSLSLEIKGKQLFQIELKKFFQINSDIDEEQRQNLVPFSIFYSSNHLFIPNKFLKKIEKYSLDGKLISSMDYLKYDIDVAKLYISEKEKLFYLLDPYEGVFVLNFEGQLIHRDEKTVDFAVSKNGNIYFQNEFDHKRAYIDKMGILSKPLTTEYIAEYTDDRTLTGIKMIGNTFDSPFIIEKINLSNNEIIFRSDIDSLCQGCFYLPRFIDDNLITASNVNILKDQLLALQNNRKLARYTLEVPIKFAPLMNIEYANYAHLGFSYSYASELKQLYGLASDKKYLRVFVFDLKAIKN